MYHPSTRLLTILELLQARGRLSGPELARRLEVSPRSVRRYIAMLQDMGIPVESERGRYGEYRLRPGYKLPPLMFSDDEALALTLGLLLVRRSSGPVDAATLEGALAKLDRVLPEAVRQRVDAVQEALVLEGRGGGPPPAGRWLALLSRGVKEQRRVWLRYHGSSDITERELEPYGVVQRGGYWYTVGFCRLREDIRVFRLDRIERAELTETGFEPPEAFDALAYVNQSIATMPAAWSATVLLETTLEEAQHYIPPAMAALEPVPDGVLMRFTSNSLDWMARALVWLACPWRVLEPPELKQALARLAQEMLERAEA